jgi:hypothetical protein
MRALFRLPDEQTSRQQPAKHKKRHHNEVDAEPSVEETKKQRVGDEQAQEIDESKVKKKKKRRIEDVDGAEVEKLGLVNRDESSNKTPPVTEDSQTTLKKKKKKKKKNRHGAGLDKPDSVDARENRTAESSDKKATNNKEKKRKHKNKLPPISEDRLRAYGISVKKFKYCHSKKLLKEQSHS